ncbi:hypothetical protein JAO29_20670 [Edaphobacter sp. HDX4]|uniref:hypothetical protein n=1 Tax=Edaphobacter sp. HDX4 TaxID=2794064 RepID=UPI002FE5D5C4
MNRRPDCPTNKPVSSLMLRLGLAFLISLASLTVYANGQTQTDNSAAHAPIRVTHILGFENARRNVSGELSVNDGELRFTPDGALPSQLSAASILSISLGEQDKQVGGVPMMLGKAALPYGGGRVISLFSHKKYDSVALEYVDDRGGLHGVVFRLPKGKAEGFRSTLIAERAHVTQSAVQNSVNERVPTQNWSVQVDRVDPAATTLDSCFSNAIYEDVVRQLNESKQFDDVFRSGDRDANSASAILILKVKVEKYSPGSETRRAVTTVSGATKIKVRIQLVAPNGQVVLERTAAGDVRFMGDNLKAAEKVAKNTAKLLKRSTLPTPATLTAERPAPTETIATK